MQKTQSTRIAKDLLEAAEVEGEREHRSMAQQIEHWARVGREFTMHDSSGRRALELAIKNAPIDQRFEGVVHAALEAETNARIQERMLTTPIAKILAREGVDTVALDENGQLVEYRADGTQHPWSDQPGQG
jgi:ParD-like antitoxin of type II bacterial toxin-antitoxin system